MVDQPGATFDEFVQGGGFLDDADVLIKTARFASWDYKGKIPEPVLALRVEAEDAEGTVHEEFLSAGDLKFFVPSEDGRRAVPVGQGNKLNINTNAVAFIVSIINADTRPGAAFAAKIRSTNDIGVLDGLKCHVIRKAQPKRAGIIQQAGSDPNRVPTQLLVEKILSYPGEAAGAAGTAPASTAAAAPAAGGGAASPNGYDDAAAFLLQLVSEAGGSMKKTLIAGKVLAHADMKAKPVAERNAMLGIIVKPEFLGSETVKGMGMVFANDTVSLAS